MDYKDNYHQDGWSMMDDDYDNQEKMIISISNARGGFITPFKIHVVWRVISNDIPMSFSVMPVARECNINTRRGETETNIWYCFEGRFGNGCPCIVKAENNVYVIDDRFMHTSKRMK